MVPPGQDEAMASRRVPSPLSRLLDMTIGGPGESAEAAPRSPGAAPPMSTVRFRALSKAIAWKARAAGPVVAFRVQALPFHPQRSPVAAVESVPPKSSTCEQSAKTMAWPNRGLGPVEAAWVQLVPSHSQVSPSSVPLCSLPPKSTARPCAVSYAIADRVRGEGPELA